jgi:hypothetical protein
MASISISYVIQMWHGLLNPNQFLCLPTLRKSLQEVQEKSWEGKDPETLNVMASIAPTLKKTQNSKKVFLENVLGLTGFIIADWKHLNVVLSSLA